MTAAEKRDIFTFLQAASASLLGYADRPLNGDSFSFQDDAEAAPVPAADQHMPVSGSGIPAQLSPEADSRSAAEQAVPQEKPASGISLQTICEKISRCQNCRLAGTRKNTVPGEGVPHPLVLVVGEGPGEMEDRSGRPFVGPAGQLLDKMLAAISLSRTTTCHIANIVKCRPPHNRDPYPDEEDACIAYLEAQIHILKPKVILAMGNIAAKKLLNTTEGISRLRGRFYDYRGIPLTATFHPSALLHNESLKRPAWEDLKFLRTWLESQQPGYENAFMQAQQAMQTQQTQDTGPAAEPQ
ncbi:MAG: uracil-DNA glycosylase [Treponema sp.]|nr:uracil-DNA glycosylase [Treponema sp.]